MKDCNRGYGKKRNHPWWFVAELRDCTCLVNEWDVHYGCVWSSVESSAKIAPCWCNSLESRYLGRQNVPSLCVDHWRSDGSSGKTPFCWVFTIIYAINGAEGTHIQSTAFPIRVDWWWSKGRPPLRIPPHAFHTVVLMNDQLWVPVLITWWITYWCG